MNIPPGDGALDWLKELLGLVDDLDALFLEKWHRVWRELPQRSDQSTCSILTRTTWAYL